MGKSAINSIKKMKLWEDNQNCFVCEKAIESYSEATLEHILPKMHGGTDAFENLALSHRFCNELKGSLKTRDEWKKKLREHNLAQDILKWRLKKSDHYIKVLIQKSFDDCEFVINSLMKFPRYYEEAQIPEKEIDLHIQHIKNLRNDLEISKLITASTRIDYFNTQPYWRIIFGLLFIEHYLKTKDIISILHAIWRLESYKPEDDSLILYSFSRELLEECRSYEPKAFKVWEERAKY